MIAYLFLVIAPFLAHAAETPNAGNILEQFAPIKIPNLSQAAQQLPNIAPIVSSATQLLTPKGRRAIEVQQTQPDAVVIPFTNKYLNYPVLKRPNLPYPLDQFNPYPYPYTPEPFVIVPVPNVPRVSVPETYNHYPYYNYPQLLYYLPENQVTYQSQNQYVQNTEQTNTQTQQVAERTVQQVGQVQDVVPQQVQSQQTVQTAGNV
ncbi:UNVERIFIED_CONTAM: hypothetical protein PYX00_008415 [Menopon gallinae]|uniref:Kappa-casein n=1 Tax=Menopon gallinae TaxID=328185 RepID=A0AAW2HMX2_9NEOP